MRRSRATPWLVVDEGAAAAVGAELAAQDDVAVRWAGPVRRAARGTPWSAATVELGADAGLPGAGAEQLAVGAAAEGQAERIEQDRLAGAGLAGQHGRGRD
jgi:predicted kinase